MERMIMATASYSQLLTHFQPKPIRSAREHSRALVLVEELMDKQRTSAAERQMIELLATLIDQYEESEWPTPHAAPGEVLAFLLTERRMAQSELSRQLAIPQSTIANVIAGRRQLSKTNVLALSRFFRVSPMLFMG
jgi:HTH-type transcriptional regulator / antitoxin HigA